MLGRVREATETKLYISLPCRMQGTVMACHISETYNKLLENYVNDKVLMHIISSLLSDTVIL